MTFSFFIFILESAHYLVSAFSVVVFWAAATIQTLLAPFAFPFPFLLPSGKELVQASQFEGVEIKAENLIELMERNHIRAE